MTMIATVITNTTTAVVITMMTRIAVAMSTVTAVIITTRTDYFVALCGNVFARSLRWA